MTDILPPSAVEIIQQCRGAGDAAAWAIGDLSAALCDELRHRFTRTAIRIAIADEGGFQPSTVKDYELTARYYPPVVRNHPTLTWWHYRQARAAGDPAVSFNYLFEAEKSADEYGGKPMPVRVLAAKMQGNGHGGTDDLDRLIGMFCRIGQKILDHDVSAGVRLAVGAAMEQLEALDGQAQEV